MWNPQELDIPPGSPAARLFLGEPLRDAEVLWLRQAGSDATLALDCGWECREYGHEPGPAGKWSQLLLVQFAGVAGLRTMTDTGHGAALGSVANVRTKDTGWRRRACVPWHFRIQLAGGVIDVLCKEVAATREDGRKFSERLREPFPVSKLSPASRDEVDRLLVDTVSGAWPERAEALVRLGLAREPRGHVAARSGLSAEEPAVIAAAIHALGFVGTLEDVPRLERLAPPPEAPRSVFRAHVEDAVARIAERTGQAGSAEPGGNARPEVR